MASTDLIFLHSNRDDRCIAVVDKYFVDYASLQFSVHGGVYLGYDDERTLLDGSWFWPAYPGPRIRFGRAPGRPSWDHRYVAFHGPLLQRWMSEGLLPRTAQRPPAGHDYAALFDDLLDRVGSSDRWSQAKAVNLLESVLIDLASDRSQAATSEPWIEHVMAAIGGDTGIFMADYEQLARECGMALSTLRRRFRAAAGVPLHSYAIQCRMAKAQERLGNTDIPIKGIAEELGYSDVYYFTHQFREFVGVSPGLYRKSRLR